MLSIIINAVFSIISSIADLIMTPIVSLISALIPSFSDFYNGIISWIDTGLTYFLFVLKLFCIPQICVTAVITVATATLSITVGVRAYKLILTAYNKFKP